MDMPRPDPVVLSNRARVLARLRAVLPADAVIDDPAETRAYECDALSAYRCLPLAVVLPRTTAEVAAALRVCHGKKACPWCRAGGHLLAGGAMPTADCVILGVARMNRVLETDYDNRFVRVEAGRTNLSVTGAVEAEGFFYAPDPSSQLACAIAGNIAMNSGGAHCLKYGVTTNNLLGVTAGADGRHRGRRSADPGGMPLWPGPVGRGLRVRGAAGRGDRGLAAHPAETRGRAAGADGV
jgi:glycolate oxidase